MTVHTRSPTRPFLSSQSTNITNGKQCKKGQCCSRTFTLIRSAGIDPMLSLFRLLAQTSLYAGASFCQMARDTFCPRKPPKVVIQPMRKAKQTIPEKQPIMRRPESTIKGKIQPAPKAMPSISETPFVLKSCLNKTNLPGKSSNKAVSFATQGWMYRFNQEQVPNTEKGLVKLRPKNSAI